MVQISYSYGTFLSVGGLKRVLMGHYTVYAGADIFELIRNERKRLKRSAAKEDESGSDGGKDPDDITDRDAIESLLSDESQRRLDSIRRENA